MSEPPQEPAPGRSSDHSSERLRILFIARAFPPTLGGMENFACQLSNHLARYADVTMIANRHGKKALPAFLPLAFARTLVETRAQRFDVVHLADALLAPFGAAVRRCTGIPVTASACGLDLTYDHALYQRILRPSLSRLDAIFPISCATARELTIRTRDRVRSRVIPLGINQIGEATESERSEFRALVAVRSDERVVLTVGRLVRRKGAAWFTRHVLPQLDPRTVYVVVGEGPDREAIAAAAHDGGVENRVRLLGRLDERLLAAAYDTADVFVMPNVPVPGDMEGFGLVALEASAAGLPVVASNLEGITEALHDGDNAVLVSPEDAQAFAAAVRQILGQSTEERETLGNRFSAYTREHFSWDETARRYLAELTEVRPTNGRTERITPVQTGDPGFSSTQM